jgi:hypothetical protein
MPPSISVGQPVAHPSKVAAVVAVGAPAASAPKTGTILSTNLPVSVPVATGHGGIVMQVSATGGALVSWGNQPAPVLMAVSDLT